MKRKRELSFVAVSDVDNQVLFDKVLVAHSHWLKFRGLMLKSKLGPREGMLFPKTNTIHCFFMRMPIDLVFMNREGVVVRLIRGIKPWRVSPIVKSAVQVLECAEGTTSAVNIVEGDRLITVAAGKGSSDESVTNGSI